MDKARDLGGKVSSFSPNFPAVARIFFTCLFSVF